VLRIYFIPVIVGIESIEVESFLLPSCEFWLSTVHGLSSLNSLVSQSFLVCIELVYDVVLVFLDRKPCGIRVVFHDVEWQVGPRAATRVIDSLEPNFISSFTT